MKDNSNMCTTFNNTYQNEEVLQIATSHPIITHLTRLTCPRPCLFLPWLRLLTVMVNYVNYN